MKVSNELLVKHRSFTPLVSLCEENNYGFFVLFEYQHDSQ